ncbi:cytochrome c oxidase cbb3-type subunit 3 [Thiogranum longum]|uniref:Cbb3-type cytochrome c oxidase subunit n=1 Tax=Thiogranum longum TaxID=1537524 RepID=A0A4R1HGZ9_9GAMM|nr:cytochrome-c oxidase, cbb3-type subunit III [Thiogranum longum]TCK19570.1 cytochrome c oxidase cbb3-type subunit 3 [Thiogranum longum]
MNEANLAQDFAFTSEFWSGWIIVLTLGNIFACWWLIRWTAKRRAGEAAEGDTTGHTWDETLAEYNNPMPRWWLWMFYITMIFGLGYLVLYPGLGSFRGVLNWTHQNAYAKEMEAADAKFGPLFAQYATKPVEQLVLDPRALRIGERLFVNYCASCHGSDAGGAPGFPNLRDTDWLYGGNPETITTTILDGRSGVMPAWKAVLGDQGIKEVTAYVVSLSGRDADTSLVTAGKQHFATYCAACHGADGKGNPALGAPNLTDKTWLYGASAGVIAKTIANGRNGHMPAHRNFLGEDKVHLLATYVYSLSNGKR